MTLKKQKYSKIMINSILAQNFALLEKVDQNFAILLLSKYSSKKSKKI